MMNGKVLSNIPGYRWDEEKQRYFKNTNNDLLANYSSSSFSNPSSTSEQFHTNFVHMNTKSLENSFKNINRIHLKKKLNKNKRKLQNKNSEFSSSEHLEKEKKKHKERYEDKKLRASKFFVNKEKEFPCMIEMNIYNVMRKLKYSMLYTNYVMKPHNINKTNEDIISKSSYSKKINYFRKSKNKLTNKINTNSSVYIKEFLQNSNRKTDSTNKENELTSWNPSNLCVNRFPQEIRSFCVCFYSAKNNSFLFSYNYTAADLNEKKCTLHSRAAKPFSPFVSSSSSFFPSSFYSFSSSLQPNESSSTPLTFSTDLFGDGFSPTSKSSLIIPYRLYYYHSYRYPSSALLRYLKLQLCSHKFAFFNRCDYQHVSNNFASTSNNYHSMDLSVLCYDNHADSYVFCHAINDSLCIYRVHNSTDFVGMSRKSRRNNADCVIGVYGGKDDEECDGRKISCIKSINGGLIICSFFGEKNKSGGLVTFKVNSDNFINNINNNDNSNIIRHVSDSHFLNAKVVIISVNNLCSDVYDMCVPKWGSSSPSSSFSSNFCSHENSLISNANKNNTSDSKVFIAGKSPSVALVDVTRNNVTSKFIWCPKVCREIYKTSFFNTSKTYKNKNQFYSRSRHAHFTDGFCVTDLPNQHTCAYLGTRNGSIYLCDYRSDNIIPLYKNNSFFFYDQLPDKRNDTIRSVVDIKSLFTRPHNFIVGLINGSTMLLDNRIGNIYTAKDKTNNESINYKMKRGVVHEYENYIEENNFKFHKKFSFDLDETYLVCNSLDNNIRIFDIYNGGGALVKFDLNALLSMRQDELIRTVDEVVSEGAFFDNNANLSFSDNAFSLVSNMNPFNNSTIYGRSSDNNNPSSSGSSSTSKGKKGDDFILGNEIINVPSSFCVSFMNIRQRETPHAADESEELEGREEEAEEANLRSLERRDTNSSSSISINSFLNFNDNYQYNTLKHFSSSHLINPYNKENDCQINCLTNSNNKSLSFCFITSSNFGFHVIQT